MVLLVYLLEEMFMMYYMFSDVENFIIYGILIYVYLVNIFFFSWYFIVE